MAKISISKSIKRKIEKLLIKKIYHDLCQEKNLCSWDKEPHTACDCKDAGYSMRFYFEELLEEYENIR